MPFGPASTGAKPEYVKVGPAYLYLPSTRSASASFFCDLSAASRMPRASSFSTSTNSASRDQSSASAERPASRWICASLQAHFEVVGNSRRKFRQHADECFGFVHRGVEFDQRLDYLCIRRAQFADRLERRRGLLQSPSVSTCNRPRAISTRMSSGFAFAASSNTDLRAGADPSRAEAAAPSRSTRPGGPSPSPARGPRVSSPPRACCAASTLAASRAAMSGSSGFFLLRGFQFRERHRLLGPRRSLHDAAQVFAVSLLQRGLLDSARATDRVADVEPELERLQQLRDRILAVRLRDVLDVQEALVVREHHVGRACRSCGSRGRWYRDRTPCRRRAGRGASSRSRRTVVSARPAPPDLP